jgi:hypothetical protein
MARKPRRKGATRAEFAAHVGLTQQRVGQLIAENVIPLHDDGSIDRDAGRLAYIDRLRTDAGRSDSARRVQDVRAEVLKFKLEKERNEWVRVEEINVVVGEILMAFRNELIGLPAGVTRDLDQRRVIESYVGDMLGRLRKRFEALEEAAKSGRPLDDVLGGGGDDDDED